MQWIALPIALLTGLIVATGIAPVLIPYFKRLKFGQFIREEGPQSHFKKAGTPTFGGAIFIISALLGALVLKYLDTPVQAVLVGMVGYGLIGFIDDYIIVVKRNNLGLKARYKMLGLVLVSALLYGLFFSGHSSVFCGGLFSIDNPAVWLVLFFFIATATTNAVNLTDGIDGLSASVTAVVAIFFSVLAIQSNQVTLGLFNILMLGALLGYLLYNWRPAKVFMGDTGSLALGGYVLCNAVLLNIEWFIPVFGVVYFLETLSVIIQVAYFKATGGKRFFKMTPIHHHFEMLGWSEQTIVTRAAVLTTIGCAFTYLFVR